VCFGYRTLRRGEGGIRILRGGIEKVLADALSQVNSRQQFFKIPITDTKSWQKRNVLQRFHVKGV
jgi:hypothetical protein